MVAPVFRYEKGSEVKLGALIFLYKKTPDHPIPGKGRLLQVRRLYWDSQNQGVFQEDQGFVTNPAMTIIKKNIGVKQSSA